MFDNCLGGSLVGPDQSLQRRVVERDVSWVHGDSYVGIWKWSPAQDNTEKPSSSATSSGANVLPT
jgi:hypothetical protein